MSIQNYAIAAVAIGCLAVAPLQAQTTTSGSGTTTTMTHEHGTMQHEMKTEKKVTKTETHVAKPVVKTSKHVTKKVTKAHGTQHQRVWTDASHLGAILTDVQSSANVSASAWKTAANEANTLANRIYAGSGSSKTARTEATSLRMHVREMRAAALKGDTAAAKTHASEAVPFNARIIEWSRPM